MSLSAKLDGEKITSFSYDEDGWNRLKKTYHHGRLETICCSQLAIPKRSPKGLLFFAHKSKNLSCTEGESPAHEYVKFLVAKSLHDAGFEVDTEVRGQTPAGELWIADVLCTVRNKAIAIEIQNSRISFSELKARQAKYAASNVRCAWYLHEKAYSLSDLVSQQSRELPMFSYELKNMGVNPRMHVFEEGMPAFSIGLLSGKLKWLPKSYEVHINIADHECWKCHETIRSNIGFGLADTGKDLSIELAEIIRGGYGDLAPVYESRVGLLVKTKYEDGKNHTSPSCLQCGAVQGVYQLMDDVWNFVNPYNSKASNISSIETLRVTVGQPNEYTIETGNHWTYNGRSYSN
jgi:hypothetical protein